MRLTETFALVSSAVDENFATDDVAEGQEHLHQLRVSELLRQVVDEEVAALGAGDRAAWEHKKIFKELTNLPLNNIVMGFDKVGPATYTVVIDNVDPTSLLYERLYDNLNSKTCIYRHKFERTLQLHVVTVHYINQVIKVVLG